MISEIVPIVPDSSEGGNTKTPSDCKKKQISPAKRWIFTWNNYPNNWFDLIGPSSANSSKISEFIYGQEVGESGTPHIQGYFEVDEKIRPTSLKWPVQIHFEKCLGTRADNIKYCSKDGKFQASRGCQPPRKLKIIETLKPWQQRLEDILVTEPDERTIHWYWDIKGGVGKSVFCKYLCVKHQALICSGKNSDMKYLIVKYHEEHGRYPEIIIMDVPRQNLDYISYTGIEEIKNGLFSSTKYECSQVIMNSPHVVVFANREPEYAKMSMDRWNVTNLDD